MDNNIQDTAAEAVDVDITKSPTANMIVSGKSGVGKSTLINAIFGKEMAATGTGKPVTKHIAEYTHPGIPISIWDTVGLELDAKVTKESTQDIIDTIAGKAKNPDLFQRIHAVWYCVAAPGNRYEPAEAEFIRSLYEVNVPAIIVITKCMGDDTETDKLEEMIHQANTDAGMDNIRVIRVLAEPYKLRGGYEVPAFGLDTLIETTLQKLPELIKSSFIAAQKISLMEKRAQCEALIWKCVKAAQNGIWNKIPLLNIIPTSRTIRDLLKSMLYMYNTVLEDDYIERIMKAMPDVDITVLFKGMVLPQTSGYIRRITELFYSKAEDQEFSIQNIDHSGQSARMVAFYGYAFLDSIEKVWNDEANEDALYDIDETVDRLVAEINHLIYERKSAAETPANKKKRSV